MQESRNKWIGTIESKKFATREDYLIFIANAIADFYTIGFDVLQERLFIEKKDLRGLARVAELVVKTKKFGCKIHRDTDNSVSSLEFTTKGTNNQWLYVYVIPGKYRDTYEIQLLSKADYDWISNVSLGDTLSVNWLMENIVEKLNNWYALDWSEDINLKAKNDQYLSAKFDRIKMRMAFQTIATARDTNPVVGISLKTALSVKDTNEIMPGNYGAETLIGKTDFVEYFVLTHLGYLIPGSHSKSVSAKTGLPHNNRKFIFQLEYSINGVKCLYLADEFADVVKQTGFLTDNPENASTQSKY